jgi:hypothetical protein
MTDISTADLQAQMRSVAAFIRDGRGPLFELRDELPATDRAGGGRASGRQQPTAVQKLPRAFSKAERQFLAALIELIAQRISADTNIAIVFRNTTEHLTAYEAAAAYARGVLPQPKKSRKRRPEKTAPQAAYQSDWVRGFSSRLSRVLQGSFRRTTVPTETVPPFRLLWQGGHTVRLVVDLFDAEANRLTPEKREDYLPPISESKEGISASDRVVLESHWIVLANGVNAVYPGRDDLQQLIARFKADLYAAARSRTVVPILVGLLSISIAVGIGAALVRYVPGLRALYHAITSSSPSPQPRAPRPPHASVRPPAQAPQIQHAVPELWMAVNGVDPNCENNQLTVSVYWSTPSGVAGPFYLLRNDQVIAMLPAQALLETDPHVYVDRTVSAGTTYCYAIARRDAATGAYRASGCFATTTPACDAANHAPIVGEVVATAERATAPTRVAVTVSAFDLDNDALTYAWSFNDGTNPIETTVPGVDHLFVSGGRFGVSVTVRDGRGGSKHGSTVLTLNGPSAAAPETRSSLDPTPEERWYGAPWADVTPHAGVMAETTFTFTAAALPPPSGSGGKPVRYRWYADDCWFRVAASDRPRELRQLMRVLPPSTACAYETTEPRWSTQFFAGTGPIDVWLEVVYDTGEVFSRSLGSVVVERSPAMQRYFASRPGLCPICVP